MPPQEKYEKYQAWLERIYTAVRDSFPAADATRTKTKFNAWVASVAGNSAARRTTEQWKTLEKATTDIGADLTKFAMVIEVAAAKDKSRKKANA